MGKKEKYDIKLRCMSFRKADKIISVCIDLDLFAEDNTFDRSCHKLFDAINLYVKHVIENDEIEQLIPRRSPLKYIIFYYTYLIMSKTIKGIRDFAKNYFAFSSYIYSIKLNPLKDTPLYGQF